MMRIITLLLLTLTLSGCNPLWQFATMALNNITLSQTNVQQTPTATPPPYTVLKPDVLAHYPHDTGAFTQGLLLAENGLLYESTGLHGQSSLREVDPQTGEVLRQVDLDAEYFAEGLALVDDRLIQLTWKSGVAFVYDIATFERIDTYSYSGEGWGLCYDGEALYMSDGSNTVFVRDPHSFEIIRQFDVIFEGQIVNNINELECVEDAIYANIWLTDVIITLDKHNGHITQIIDASDLLTDQERMGLGSGGTLNGIAYNPNTETFLITGKLYPKLYDVRFVPYQ